MNCSPNAICKAALLLSTKSKAMVKQIGFRSMLMKMPNMLPNRRFAAWLMDRAMVEGDHIELNVKDGTSLRLTLEDVYLILGIGKQRGSLKKLPTVGQSQYDNAYDELFKILKYAHDKWILPQKKEKAKVDPRSTSEEKGASQVDHQSTSDADKVMGNDQDEEDKEKGASDADKGKVKAKDLTKAYKRKVFTTKAIQHVLEHKNDKEMKNQVNDELAIKFFCILVLNKLLLPTAGNQIPKPVIEVVIDTEKLKAVDWCTIIYKALRDGIRS